MRFTTYTISILLGLIYYSGIKSVKANFSSPISEDQIKNTPFKINCPNIYVSTLQKYFTDFRVLAILNSDTEILGCLNENKIQVLEDGKSSRVTDLVFYERNYECVNQENIHTWREIINQILNKTLSWTKTEQNTDEKQLNFLHAYISVNHKKENETVFLATKNQNLNYIYGYFHNNQFYVILTQPSNEGGVVTKIIRFCKNIQGLLSRSDLVISCDKEADSSDHQNGISAQFTANENLIVKFLRTTKNNEETVESGDKTCSFSVNKLNEGFTSHECKSEDCGYVVKGEPVKESPGEFRANPERLTQESDGCSSQVFDYSCTSRAACRWCSDKCRTRSDCPVINVESSQTGPLAGGTIVRLNVSFGFHDVTNKDHQIEFTINGKRCKPRNETWKSISKSQRSFSVECESPEQKDVYTGPILLRIKNIFNDSVIDAVNSSNTFSYKKPELSQVWPGFGPKSGGTLVTFFGSSLDIGSNQTITLDGLDCEIKERNSTHILCLSQPFNSGDDKNNAISLTIDKQTIKPKGKTSSGQPWKFLYKEDPVITRVDRNSTFLRGKINLTVYGRNLTSVANPKIVVNFDRRGKVCSELTEECKESTEQSSSKIICPTPTVSQNCSSELGRNVPFKARLTFKMDGVPSNKLFGNIPGLPGDMYYYPDPTFQKFVKNQTEANIYPDFVVQGTNFKGALMPEDVKISLDGTAFCTVTEIAPSNIRCKFAKEDISRLKEVNSSTLYELKANLFGQDHLLGHVIIHAPSTEDLTKLAETPKNYILGPVLISISLLIVLCIIILIFKRRRKTKSKKREIPFEMYNHKQTCNKKRRREPEFQNRPMIQNIN